MKTALFALALLLPLFLFSGAASSAPSGRWQQLSSSGMSYWLYLPASPGPHSLMINLHGCAQTGTDLKQDGNWEEAADRYGIVVAIPNVPHGGVVFGCWDYYGTDQNPGNRDNAPLLALTQELLGNAALAIDAKKVFVSGLSAGATQAMLLGCMRPDLFAGVGMNSGPVLGSGEDEISFPRTTPAQSEAFCRKLAGPLAPFFASQLASTINGDQDFVVNQQHSVLSREFLSSLYGARKESAIAMSSLPGPNTSGHGSLYADSAGHARLSYLVNNGVAHAWFAGAANAQPGGPTLSGMGNYIADDCIDYPLYLARFFLENGTR